MAMDIWRKREACDSEKEFTAEPKAWAPRSSSGSTDELVVDVEGTLASDGGPSYGKIAVNMSCHKWTTCKNIRQDTGYSYSRKL